MDSPIALPQFSPSFSSSSSSSSSSSTALPSIFPSLPYPIQGDILVIGGEGFLGSHIVDLLLHYLQEQQENEVKEKKYKKEGEWRSKKKNKEEEKEEKEEKEEEEEEEEDDDDDDEEEEVKGKGKGKEKRGEGKDAVNQEWVVCDVMGKERREEKRDTEKGGNIPLLSEEQQKQQDEQVQHLSDKGRMANKKKEKDEEKMDEEQENQAWNHSIPWCIHILDIQPAARWANHDKRVQFHQHSLMDSDALLHLLKNECIQSVIHTASPPAHGRPREVYWELNVEGTQRIMNACLLSPCVKYFIYTSSSSVVFDGSDLEYVNETKGYAKRALDAYTETKAIAESIVLTHNGHSQLHTCVLRPAALFGPRDQQCIPELLKSIPENKGYRYLLGSGDNLFDFTYIENAAYAHVLALSALQNPETCKKVQGCALFVTNDEPIPFWEFPKRVLSCGVLPDHEVKTIGSHRIPKTVAMLLAYLLLLFDQLRNFFYCVVKTKKTWTPTSSKLTPFRVTLTTAIRHFDISRAKETLGYRPLYSLNEGIQKTMDWFKNDAEWGPWIQDQVRKLNMQANAASVQKAKIEKKEGGGGGGGGGVKLRVTGVKEMHEKEE